MNGAQYVKTSSTSSYAGSDPVPLGASDFYVIHTQSANDSIQLPDPSLNTGRVFILRNNIGSTIYVVSVTYATNICIIGSNGYSNVNAGIGSGDTRRYTSDGTYWYESY